MLLSLPSWDYFQCKSLLLECAVLIMTQKLLWLLLWGMISFCSNAQRNVLLPNCCSRQLICRFFPVSGEMSHSCFGFYLSGLPGGGRVGKGRGLEPSQPRNLLWPSPGLSPPWGAGLGVFLPWPCSGLSLALGPEPSRSGLSHEEVPSWGCLGSFLSFGSLGGSDFPHPQGRALSAQQLLVELAGTCSATADKSLPSLSFLIRI